MRTRPELPSGVTFRRGRYTTTDGQRFRTIEEALAALKPPTLEGPALRPKRPVVSDAARTMIETAIYRGMLARGACEVCGKANTTAWHDDPAYPLQVRWFCAAHPPRRARHQRLTD
jgi:hypothetical protein